MSLKKSVLKNGFAAAIQKVVKVLEQITLVPLFITYWGVEQYGEWLTITIIPTVFALSDIGFGTASANTFLIAYAKNESKEAAKKLEIA